MNYEAVCQSDNTLRAYGGAWRRFVEWCDAHRQPSLPATGKTVAEYLSHLADEGKKPATIATARSAIDSRHSDEGHAPPGAERIVKNTVRGINRTLGVDQRQAVGLTADVFERMVMELDGDWRYWETLAIIAVMRDGLLRGGELCALRVKDFEPQDDGTARLKIRRSKTDQEGEGAVVWLSPAAAARLAGVLRRRPRASGYIFGPRGAQRLSRQALADRIKLAASAAGFDPREFSTHSCRVGMAQDLAAANMSSVSIAQAGRWDGVRQVVRYTRNQEAAKGAVARWHAKRQKPAGGA